MPANHPHGCSKKGRSPKLLSVSLRGKKEVGLQQCVLSLCHIYDALSKANTGEGEVWRRQTGSGPSANSRRASEDGSQAEAERAWEADLGVCGIRAVKSTVIKPRIPSSLIWAAHTLSEPRSSWPGGRGTQGAVFLLLCFTEPCRPVCC